jgi:hypothetical protein
MANDRRADSQPLPPPHSLRPLDNLRRVQPVYFFTPDLEREINKLDGVTSCRVLSTGVEIEEIHVISPPDRTPKKVVRDIESLLLVHFGIRIDHRKISIVQLGQPAASPSALDRPGITSVEKRTTADGMQVCVEINSNGSSFRGVVAGEAGDSDLQLSSRALILALEKLLNRPGVLALEEVTVLRIGDQDIVLALLRWLLGERIELLVGATVARGDPLEDAARATFDAVNRKLVRARPPRRKN